MDVKNTGDFFRRKGVDTLSERTVFGLVTASDISTETEGMQEALDKLYEKRAQDGEDEETGRDVDDEVFRQQYIPQTLQQVYDIERDGDKIQQGNSEPLVYQNLLADKVADGGAVQPPDTSDLDDAARSSEDEGVGDSDSEGDESEREEWGEQKPRGKRYEDKDTKREHKQAVKEEKREKRKDKMPKHVKKKLVNQKGRGKR